MSYFCDAMPLYYYSNSWYWICSSLVITWTQNFASNLGLSVIKIWYRFIVFENVHSLYTFLFFFKLLFNVVKKWQEIENRVKLVKRMWGAYMHSERGPLPSFWQEAFEAAYEDISGDDEQARQAAISEIARMSLRMLNLDPPPSINLKVITTTNYSLIPFCK